MQIFDIQWKLWTDTISYYYYQISKLGIKVRIRITNLSFKVTCTDRVNNYLIIFNIYIINQTIKIIHSISSWIDYK